MEGLKVALVLALVAGCARDPSAETGGVPAALAASAKAHGLVMLGSGFSWTPYEAPLMRGPLLFSWSGDTTTHDRTVLYDFEPDAAAPAQKLQAIARQLASAEPRALVAQGSTFVEILGVDRVLSAEFEVAPPYGTTFHHGIAHAIVKGGALTIVVVLSNDTAAAVVPMPRSIGAKGA